MKTVILCGGKGTRIRDVADNIPKPMIPIGGIPILWHIMNYYSNWSYKDFILCLGYKNTVIKDFFLNYRAHTSDFTISLGDSQNIEYFGNSKNVDWKVTLAETGLEAMTGSRIRKIRKYLNDDENFMLTYGDGLSDININKLVNFHKSHGKILTVSGVRPPGRFGELVCNSHGLATEFNEKPQTTGGLISGGYFVCRRELLDYLTDDDSLVFEKDPMQRLVSEKQLMVYEHEGFWQPMDTYREYQLLNEMYDNGNAPWVFSN
ncbi:glucose-1-phosphate cytidylyltransferase [Fluviispira vulneris]|uniref:glucose-1-phosphate cytidylyltransferase n=1 Tax=Fluviispira vulneris TaxID=2763012 RepID=UPI00164443E9|nr:glucose-1-phosphate cytidylyltransferase [Fluviispira vulneris]